jgi:S1-C subfamily serine protease
MRAASRLWSRTWAGDAHARAACGLLVLLALAPAAHSQAPPPQAQVDGRARPATARKPASANAPRRKALPSDDWTYRPTVLVRKGTSQGSGTIIASVDGETLVLTAAHVVASEGPVSVELHKYNLGMERAPRTTGVWPRVVPAVTAARDSAADVAIVRIEKMIALPYVARLAPQDEKPPIDSVVSSIGIDLGRKLSLWNTRLVETASIALNENREPRPFLITDKIPEHGRSGGGLFLASGELVGVCVGHAELHKGHRRGIFAAGESIRLLLAENDLNVAVHRSERRMARLTRGRSPATRAAAPEQPGSLVSTSRSKVGETFDPNDP